MKRFTETQKWEDPWFRRLSIHHKALWSWLLDKCDNAGVIEPDIELASFQIGYQYPMDTLSVFGDRLVKVGPEKWFIPKFIGFQYGVLSPDCKAHNPVFASLKKHGLEGYPKGIHTLKEKDKDKDKEMDTETDQDQERKYPEIIRSMWAQFSPKSKTRSSMKKLDDAWKAVKPKPDETTVIDSLKKWVRCNEWTKDGGQFAPGAHIWVKDRKWEFDPEIAQPHQPTLEPVRDVDGREVKPKAPKTYDDVED